MSSNNKEAIAKKLIEEGYKIFNKPKSDIVLFIRSKKYSNVAKEADRLLNDFEKFPHAFVIGCIADRQVNADVAWLTPYNIYTKVENFKIEYLSTISLDKFKEIMNSVVPKHKILNVIASCIKNGIDHILKKYNGDASKIWTGNPKASEVAKRFKEFNGIGQKISSMATNILARDFKIQFADYKSIDISADIQVEKVFKRLGLCGKDATLEEIVLIARKLHPEYPGIMDLSVWEIGRDYCLVTNPKCNHCPMTVLCPRKY